MNDAQVNAIIDGIAKAIPHERRHMPLPPIQAVASDKGWDKVKDVVAVLAVAAICWAAVAMTSVNTQIGIINSKMESFQKFMEEPRFTKDDFRAELRPVSQSIENNTKELNYRRVWIQDSDKRFNDIDRRFMRLESNIETTSNDIREIKTLLKRGHE